ncbi:MAG: GNAT family N-acetyltransferase [Candidatus Nanopelagicales bacterium]|nr:GNAT family N-acetyltransferase [Candidatus Nanopelagicales bacterium]
MFVPLRTERLVVRAPRPEDVERLWAWRNEPEVAALQAWSVPFPRTTAQQHITSAIATGAPVDGDWWTAVIEDAASGEALGELVVRLANDARTAELGFSLARRHWGRGYAVEALAALIAHLFETFPLTRAWGALHPDNRASAMVLERCGLVFEGCTRLSFWLGDDNSDDWIYGMTREDWEAWRDRDRGAPEEVRLAPITEQNAFAVRALRTHHSQRAFVAPVLESFADALVPETVDGVTAVPWLRAIEADGRTAGFVMLALPDRVHRSAYLWRLLIDRVHQRRGIASRALDLVIEECRALGATELTTSWSEGKGSPGPFYHARGFEPTGRLIDGEVEALLPFG